MFKMFEYSKNEDFERCLKISNHKKRSKIFLHLQNNLKFFEYLNSN